jgi:uncharacterized protein
VSKRRKKREQVREQVQAAPQKLRVQPMDLFRAQDAAGKVVARMSAAARTSDGFENAISRLGLNQDNALSAGTYQFDLVTRNRILLEMAYRGSWICGQVVDCVAEDMTREGIDVTTSEAEEKLPDFKAAFTRKQIFPSICNGIKWGRLYGGGLGVMNIDGQNLATPLRIDTVGKGQFKGIMVYDRWMLNPVMDPIIPDGPNAGLPVFYQIVSSLQAGSPQLGAGNQDTYVHHSRIFRFGGIKLPFFQAITEMMWDESVLERLWDRLISFDNATLSAASLIDRANLRTVGIEGLREIISAGGEALDGLQGQFEMMRLAQVNEGLTLLDKNDEFASTSYSFAGIPETLMQFGQQLSGASQIPLVRLFGQSPAGLNSTGEGDIRLYYDGIKAKQEANLRQPMAKLIRVMWRSEFGTPPPKDLDFTFTPLWQMDPKDQAEIGDKNAETIGKAFDRGLLSKPTAMKELRQLAPASGLFNSITDEDIVEAELEPPPMPDAPAGEPPIGENNPQPVDNPEGVREPVQEKPAKTADRKWRWWWG